ncbi:MAG: tRNA-dihydrouridine synthase family protein [Oscillospiraceae bacterium]|nr:tRNA-dihydrouridine synthase family protein [Oscillospiraceae bacterium]
MEGLTDSIYRRVHHAHFPGVDAYYMPFISPTVHRCLTNRESRELPMADSVPFRAVPQLMTKVPEDFLWAAEQCRERGYDEVNLNAGCPSGTVVAKGKGAGMLAKPDELDRFLDAVFAAAPLPVSVKTRLGVTDPEEFPKLLEVFNRYPIKELTVHPRVRQQFYKGDVFMDSFRYCLKNSKIPLCYNGNLRTMSEVKAFEAAFPQVEAVMIGRGLIGNPGMLSHLDAAKLEAFHDQLLEEYVAAFGGARNAMFRLKENWRHMILMFKDSDKMWKKLRKTTDLDEFLGITNQIFRTLPLADELQADW